ncbi:MAG: two-component system sensor histidine kinase NtrB, partial [Rhodospirillales bacterium]
HFGLIIAALSFTALVSFLYARNVAVNFAVQDQRRRHELQRQRAYQAVRASEAKLSAIIDAAADPIMTVDLEGTIASVNAAFSTTFGYSAEEILGQNVSFIVAEHQRSRHDAYVQQMLEASEAGVLGVGKEIQGLRKNGEIIPCRVSLSRVDVEDQSAFVVLLYDQSEQKRMETSLREALKKAEAGVQAKTDFLATMSHELRTPLNAILGFSDIMAMEMFGPLGDQKYKEYVADIKDSANHLLAIVEEILTFAKLGSDQVELHREDIDLRALSDDCFMFVKEQASNKGIELERAYAPSLPTVRTDRKLLKQALINLLANAVKFTPEGGKVSFSADVGGDWVSLTVSDNGIGMAEEALTHIGEPFLQIERYTTGSIQEGTGLGLSIVNKFTDLIGGRLNVESAPGEGTSVTIQLPLRV